MAAITVRNLSPETHRALRVRAAENGRSAEAEVREIIDQAVRPVDRVKIGTALVDTFHPLGGVDLNIERDDTAAEPASFE